MLRKIITINEELCDGCGNCVTGCSEGALAIVNGKAKLVNEVFCDGFGDCIGTCPTDALEVEEREAADFDLEATKNYLLEEQGVEAVHRMVKAQRRHHANQEEIVNPRPVHAQHGGGCPGSQMRVMNRSGGEQNQNAQYSAQVIPSELTHWPIQLHLVHPQATFFNGRELVFMSTCGPIASADVHWKYIRGRSIIVGCPKLDVTSNYAAKLGEILRHNDIPKLIIVRIEVPCCGGLTAIAMEALTRSGRNDVIIEEHILGTDGSFRGLRIVADANMQLTPR